MLIMTLRGWRLEASLSGLAGGGGSICKGLAGESVFSRGWILAHRQLG